jgi:ABC-type amino acid transport substrate-binding protein
MKSRIYFFSLIFIALGIFLSAFIYFGKNKSNNKVLRFATCPEDEPFSYLLNNKVVGLEFDLAKKFSERMGYTLEVYVFDIQRLISALTAKKIDFAMSSLSKTEARQKVADFSNSYAISNIAIVVNKNSNIKSLKDFKNQHILVAKSGTVQHKYLEHLKNRYKYSYQLNSRNSSNTTMLNEVLSNRIDGFACMQFQAEKFVSLYKNMQYFLMPFDEEDKYLSEMYAIFPKKSELLKEFNTMLADLKKSGELDQLYKKYNLK